MDQRLVEAARGGDINTLQNLLKEDPQILEKACSVHFTDSPLRVAALSGKADFVTQIVTLMPSLATETNQQGMIPLHLASLKGHVQTVKELLKAKLVEDGGNQCLVKDEEGWTPLHCASQKGKISVIEELIMACPEFLKEATTKGETVVHIAVKANQLETVKVLAHSIKRHKFHNLLKAQDQKGKSAYDLAAAKKQFQVVEVLKEDDEIREERPINIEGESNEEQKMMSNDKGQSKQEAMLVVGTLLITLTYQALANPPTTLFKDGSFKMDLGCSSRKHGSLSQAGNLFKECPGALPFFFFFLFFNSLIFVQSIFIVVWALRGERILLALELLMMTLIECYTILLTALNHDLFYFLLAVTIIVPLAFMWLTGSLEALGSIIMKRAFACFLKKWRQN